MTCGLEPEELHILNVLYGHRCVSEKHSYNLKQISNAFFRKYGKDPNDVADGLAGKGYIALWKKKDKKYYISNIPKAMHALGEHNYNVIQGRYRRL